MTSAVRWLLEPLPPQPIAPLVVGATHVREELEAMRVEGLVVPVGAGVYLPADALGSAEARRAALGLVVPSGTVAGLATAAWLHGAPVRPDPVDVLIPHSAGPRPVRDGVCEHRTTVTAADVVGWPDLLATTPERTAADLARQLDDDRSMAALRWLLDHGVRERQVLAVLRANGRFRNNRNARALLRGLRDERARQDEGLSTRRPVSR